MYCFEPSDEQKMLVDAISKFAAQQLRPAAREADETCQLPRSLIAKGWELGMLQASIPEAYGGFGERSAVTGALAAEAMAQGDLSASFAVGVPGLFAIPILIAGSEGQKQKYLPEIASGAWSAHSGALIEYRFDFDPSALSTTAVQQDGGYVLNGEKAYVPFAAEAQSLMVYASLNGQTQGFIVPTGSEGLSVSPEPEKLTGLRALPMHRIQLKDVRVPAEARLGGAAGHDFRCLLAAMQVAQAAAAVGVAKGALEYARDYAKEREAFGVKIAQKQAVAFMLAEMCTEIEAMRLLTWEAAWKIDAGQPDAYQDAYLASTGAADMVMTVTDRAVQILGGHGYIREHPVEMWMRNGRGFATFTGLTMV